MVTIKDIAKAAGVTYVTVSRALNDSPSVSEKMKQRIRAIAEQMNYTPNMAARRLLNRKTNCIGLIWPAIQGLFFYHLGAQIQREGAKRGYRVILSMADPAESMRTFAQLFVDSVVVWTHTTPDADFLKAVGQFQGDMLWLGDEGLAESHCIAINRRKGLFEGVRHLAGLGHRKIAFVGGVTDKLLGYAEGMAACKLDYDPQRIIHVHDKELPDKLIAMMGGAERPTAIAADSQGALFRIIPVLRGLRLRVPDDISLLVYDDVPELEIFEVSLTTVGPSIAQLAVKAVDILTGAVKPEEGERWVKQVMDAELTVRQSTRAIRS